ncbi:putative colanic acid biosynthesis acetyltransferase WcaF [Oxalobacteraceae bacterium GrIS 2.11]
MIIQKDFPYTGPSFSLQNRLGRLVWGVTCIFLFRLTPRVMHGWRCMILRLFGAQIGRHVHIHANVKIWAPWNLVVSDYVGIGDGVNLYCMDKIVIGEYAVISQGAHLCAGSHDFNQASFQLITAPIKIGARAWVCADAFVGMGVTIPEGVVLGARALAGKSIDETWTVWGGVPAKKIGTRDRQRVCGLE